MCVCVCVCVCVCCVAGGAGGSGELPAGGAEQPEGAEAAAGEDGQHCHRTDVPGEPGEPQTKSILTNTHGHINLSRSKWNYHCKTKLNLS